MHADLERVIALQRLDYEASAGRKKLADAKEPGVSDAVFMSSRDGVNWTPPATWLRPGPDPHNWTDRNNMPAWGIVQTSPNEFSMYVSEHYRWPDNRLRRVTVRRHGFVAAHADAKGGEFTTPVLKFAGSVESSRRPSSDSINSIGLCSARRRGG